MSGYLPPGCSESDIPGNRPEDVAWEEFHELVDRFATQHALTPREAMDIWTLGLSKWSGR